METITVDTHSQEELVDITQQVQRYVAASGVQNGLAHLMVQHTTAGITINENADLDVKSDLLMALRRVVQESWPFQHAEGNSPAHLKSSMVGCSTTIPIKHGRLVLGTWQGIFLCEHRRHATRRQLPAARFRSSLGRHSATPGRPA